MNKEIRSFIASGMAIASLAMSIIILGCAESIPKNNDDSGRFATEFSGAGPAWSTNGNDIAFFGHPTSEHDSGKGIWLINADGTNARFIFDPTLIDPEGWGAAGLDWSDDDFLVFFFMSESIDYPAGTYYIPAFGGDPILIVEDARCPAIRGNLDGIYNLAYVNSDEADNGIYLSDINGSPPQLIVPGNFIFDPDWSPDGTKLTYTRCYWSEGYPVYQLCVYNLACNSEQIILDGGYGISCPQWSPDGQLIAYAEHYFPSDFLPGPAQKVVWVIPPEGGGPRRLMDFPYPYGWEEQGVDNLSWSPDGMWIVYDLLGQELWKLRFY